MTKKMWTVVTKEGVGWDLEIGGTFYPRQFVTAASARNYARRVFKKYRVETFVVPSKVTYRKPNLPQPKSD